MTAVTPASDPERARPGLLAPALLFFFSGFAGLTYQVLWQRELGLLFGNTTQATATTLAVFFLGLAVGSWWLGARSIAWRRPLLAFARLELGIALSAMLVFVLLPLYRLLFAPLYDVLGGLSPAFLAAKFVLAALVLGLPAFLMGGTLPVLAELAARRGRGLAGGGVLLYAVNTAGAMVGALAAGFVLPRALGYRGAYGVAMAVSIVVGLIAAALDRRTTDGVAAPPPSPAPGDVAPRLLLLAGVSGFAALGLEVLWARMIALAFQNSVYTFAAVVAVVLGALVLGAAVARLLARRVRSDDRLIHVLLVLTGLATAASPYLFRAIVDSSGAVGAGAAWGTYVLLNFGVLAACVLPPAVLLGTVFPLLLRAEENRRGPDAAGARLGRLLAVNTAGALLGAVTAGFVLPGLVGLWGALALFGALYLAAAVVWTRRRPVASAGAAFLLVGVVVIAWASRDAARTWSARPGETVLAVYEGGAGTVMVVDRQGDLKLKFNNTYTLGGTSEPRWEHYQAHIPLGLHPNPQRVFFLGMGTGITAGAALRHDVKRVRVAEIVPEAVRATKEHFGPWLGGLLESPRADIVVEDGRTVLLGSHATYDVVVGDLFLPWRRGTALLYTVEQFEAVRARLTPTGLYCQWLPLYQLGEAEFRGIARSFLQVFPGATLWRGDFFDERPIVALVGHRDEVAWDGAATARAWERLQAQGAIDEGASAGALPFLFYAGRLAYAQDELRTMPALHDDDPWMEFEAPIAQREREAGRARPFVGRALAEFQRRCLRVDEDPFLARLDRTHRRLVEGGLHLYDLATAPIVGGHDLRGRALAGFIRCVPHRMRPDFDRWLR